LLNWIIVGIILALFIAEMVIFSQDKLDYVAFGLFFAVVACILTALFGGTAADPIMFSDFVELYIPPKTGRSHILRLIREILFFQPQGRKTDLIVPLDFINGVAKRKCVTFLISDFCLPGDFEEGLARLHPKLQISNRRHDLISMIISDPREHSLPDIGWLTIEDAESGAQVELDTSNPAVRKGYAELAEARKKNLHKVIRSAGVDLLDLSTDESYVPPLLNFFGNRRRRLSR